MGRLPIKGSPKGGKGKSRGRDCKESQFLENPGGGMSHLEEEISDQGVFYSGLISKTRGSQLDPQS